MGDGKNLALKVASLASSGIKSELIREAIEKASTKEVEIKNKFFGEKTKEIYHKSFNKLSVHCYQNWLHVKVWDYRSSRSFSQAHVLSYNTLTGETKIDTTDPRVDESLIKLAKEFLKEVLSDDKNEGNV